MFTLRHQRSDVLAHPCQAQLQVLQNVKQRWLIVQVFIRTHGYKTLASGTLNHVVYFLYPEDGGDTVLRNVG
jgi:hypothetical protein